MILLNLQLRDGGIVSISAGAIEAIGQEDDGYAFVDMTSGKRWVSNIHGEVEVSTGEIEEVLLEGTGIPIQRAKKIQLSATEQLRNGVLAVMDQAGNRMDVRHRLTRPAVVGVG